MSPQPYYQDDSCTIYHGDCRDVVPGLSGIGVVVTSPPYNLRMGIDGVARVAFHERSGRNLSTGRKAAKIGAAFAMGYESHDDGLPIDEYVQWQQHVVKLCWDSLRSDGAIFYNHKPRVQGGRCLLPTAYIPDGVTLRQIIIWDRSGTGVAWSPAAYNTAHEWILLLAHADFRLKGRRESGIGDLWRFPPEHNVEGHPCPYPVGLPARVLDTAAVNGPVLDPFMGSGSTLRAAKDAGLKAVGIEIEERYCEIAARRLAQEVLPL